MQVPEQDGGLSFEGRAVISAFKWIPKSKVSNKDALLRAACITGYSNTQPLVIQLAVEEKYHIRLPRHLAAAVSRFITYEDITEQVQYERIDYKDNVTPRDARQEAAWKALSAADNGILNIACGGGKALAHGEPVQLLRGETPIEEVLVGDYVLGTDGDYHRVTGVFPQGERDLYDVHFTDGTCIRCDGDHLWTFRLPRDRGKEVTITTKQLRSEELRGTSGRKYFVPAVSAFVGKDENLLIDPYTLGLLLGDACLREEGCVVFTTADVELVHAMVLPEGNRAARRKHDNSGAAYDYTIGPPHGVPKEKHIKTALKELGLLGASSYTKFIPKQYLLGTPATRLAILQGLLDTDGNVKRAFSAEYTTVSSALRRDVTYLVFSLGGTCTSSVHSSRYRTARGERSEEFLSYRLQIKLPGRLPAFRLKNKLREFSAGDRQREPYRAVDAVIPAGVGLATCISVDSPDHLYLARNFIPTHNTILGLKKVAQRGVPAIVFVNNSSLLEQWIASAQRVLGLSTSDIGIVQQDQQEWDRPFVVAMLQTVVAREDSIELATKLRFGTVIFDEAHRTAASTFIRVAGMFYGARYGLTATIKRVDRLEAAYLAHLGPVIYTDDSSELYAEVQFRELTCVPAPAEGSLSFRGTLLISRVYDLLRTSSARNKTIVQDIVKAVGEGRRPLVLTHSVPHLELLVTLLKEALPCATIGAVHGKIKAELRTSIFNSSVVTVASFTIAKEGLDVPMLDTLFLVTPFKDKGAFQQCRGRVERIYQGKQSPLVVVYDDIHVGPAHLMCSSLRKAVRERDKKRKDK